MGRLELLIKEENKRLNIIIFNSPSLLLKSPVTDSFFFGLPNLNWLTNPVLEPLGAVNKTSLVF